MMYAAKCIAERARASGTSDEMGISREFLTDISCTSYDFETAYKKIEAAEIIKTTGVMGAHEMVEIGAWGAPPRSNDPWPFPNEDDSHYSFVLKNEDGLKALISHLEKKFPKRDRSLIRRQALELIARKIGDTNSGHSLAKQLAEHRVPERLIRYPNTKWRMLYDVFEYLSFSALEEENALIFSLFEEFSHPLALDGDRKKATEFQDDISALIEYDGYAFQSGKIVPATDELLSEIHERSNEKKQNATQAWTDFLRFGIGAGQRINKESIRKPDRRPVTQQSPIEVHLHNTINNNLPLAERIPEERKKLKTATDRISIGISQTNGIYVLGQEMKNYGIRGSRSNIVWALKDGKRDGPMLAGLYTNGNLAQLSNAISEINRLFKKTLGLTADLIIPVPTGGYSLNVCYIIQFNS